MDQDEKGDAKLDSLELDVILNKPSRSATESLPSSSGSASAPAPPSRSATIVGGSSSPSNEARSNSSQGSSGSKWKEDTVQNNSQFVQNAKSERLLEEDLKFRKSMIVEALPEDQLEHQEWKLLREKSIIVKSRSSDLGASKSTGDVTTTSSGVPIADFKRHFSIRAVIVGAMIGCMLCFSNMYFGLQTGWVTLGSLQAALLGFGFFRVFKDTFHHFNAQENVLLQTTSVACATIPIAAGFVGIIPALQLLAAENGSTFSMTVGEMILWGLALGFFGVFFAVPLRKQTIVVEKLTFPSGTATARLIEMLHKNNLRSSISSSSKQNAEEQAESERVYLMQWKVLGGTFAGFAFINLMAYFAPQLNNLPIFSWIGLSVMTQYLWTFQLSFGYIGQGMIMGVRSAFSMLAGCIIGFGILSPYAKSKGWAPGPVSSWLTGGQGWILWISLAMMIAESLSSLAVLTYSTFNWRGLFQKLMDKMQHHSQVDSEYEASLTSKKNAVPKDDGDVPTSEQVSTKLWVSGLIVSTIWTILVFTFMFDQQFYEPLLATFFALLVSILAVRSLGETDLNPVSGIGKISQIFFALISPGNIRGNIIAGAIAEAGASQAGDLMQDLKTGFLLNASPKAQFYGQLIGTTVSVFASIAAFKLYTNAYGVPSATLPAPTSQVWLDMAKLMNGGQLPPMVIPFAVGFACVSALLPVIGYNLEKSGGLMIGKSFKLTKSMLPSGVAMAIGMYIAPNFTLPRVVGATIFMLWNKYHKDSLEKYMIVAASGLVLGEGVMSIFTALLKTMNVPTFPQ
eukprot:TRINITY_DN15771_c0_g1_i1.p1 TRINITY_DN15771_c0_g1~~TRINITY_DN15771_c0_g1_i1.p1  ORF type:complete len:795 (+),score=202.69 TRINITY_DN15771_c0_g1_i1:185-2569(+)